MDLNRHLPGPIRPKSGPEHPPDSPSMSQVAAHAGPNFAAAKGPNLRPGPKFAKEKLIANAGVWRLHVNIFGCERVISCGAME